MKIIIAGAGEVGYHLAKQLSSEEHDITVIDVDQNILSRTDSSTDVMTLHGSSTSIKMLENANVEETDLCVAVTSSEAININTAILAKRMGAKKTIARVNNGEYVNPKNTDVFRSLGVDNMVYPEELAAIEVVKLIERAAATDILDFEDGKLSLLGLKLDRGVPIIDRTLKQIAAEYSSIDFRIVALHRGFQTIIPYGDDIFRPNDQLFVISKSEGMEKIIQLTSKDKKKLNNIMILGGGKIGRLVAKMLEKKIDVKLIESNHDKSVELADYLEESLVIHGDGRDLDLLAQEGIIDMDGFVAVTENAETNIITCLMAKHLGVSKTIAQVDNVDYIALTQTIGLDSLINKKLIAANSITRFIKKSNVVATASLQGIDADIFEFIARDGSKITKSKIKDLKFPKNAIIGGIIRGGEGIITVGDTQILAEDKVVVFALPGAVSDVQKFFN
ncbi:MAG: Trk system potassium transporter TrkA [Melioribacteraceae bacterium]|nr:Trk system potassium transporter TrkA [Melioribacteraceae bacterium]MCF8263787.1 Trk system potassium transporter TrkA [Melioribacteraceae bacterium]MCF8412368.1 Trk system potassium transporter TrkA [Melioribacteraceae bacterium]MCF8430780.1 Trk system potassium transporter TrkA [Melioribacteraceae bacterium]